MIIPSDNVILSVLATGNTAYYKNCAPAPLVKARRNMPPFYHTFPQISTAISLVHRLPSVAAATQKSRSVQALTQRLFCGLQNGLAVARPICGAQPTALCPRSGRYKKNPRSKTARTKMQVAISQK